MSAADAWAIFLTVASVYELSVIAFVLGSRFRGRWAGNLIFHSDHQIRFEEFQDSTALQVLGAVTLIPNFLRVPWPIAGVSWILFLSTLAWGRASKKVEFHQLGILYGWRLISWRSIKNWEWEGRADAGGSEYVLGIRRKRVGFFLRETWVRFVVSSAKMDEVTYAMQHYFGE